MSQASGGEELWQCVNPACTPDPMPLSFGKRFKVCPFCEAVLTTPSKLVTTTAGPPLQTATPEAVTSTSNLDILTPRTKPSRFESETTENSTHLAGAEHLIHPPSAEGVITVNQSDVGVSDTKGALGDTETHIYKETKSTTASSIPGENIAQGPSNEKLTQGPSNNPPSENLMQDHTNDPSSLGPLGGAAKLEAGTVEAGSSNQDATSPEFLHVGVELISSECNTSSSIQPMEKKNDFSCTYCGKNIFDPKAKKCSDCHNMSKSPLGPPCEHCGENLLTLDAFICTKCNRSQRDKMTEKLLDKTKSDTVSPKDLECPLSQPYSQVFGPQPSTVAPADKWSQVVANIDDDHVTLHQSNRKRTSSLSRRGTQRKHFKQEEGCSSDGEAPKVGSLPFTSPNKQHEQNDPNETSSQDEEGNTPGATGATKMEGAYYKKQPFKGETSRKNKKGKKKKGNNECRDELVHDTKDSANALLSESPVEESVYVNLRGLNGRRLIDVVFHVIISKPFWEWDRKSCIFLRFGGIDLGDWKQNIGAFVQRDIDEIYCEMSCHLKLNPDVLHMCIPYKYVVFTPKTGAGRTSPFEYLGISYSYITRKQEFYNRILKISSSKLEEGSYHQFDTMALPGDMKISRTWYETAKSGIKSMFGLQEKLKRPTQLETKQLCLNLYLKLHRYNHILISGQFDETLAINKYVEEVQHIFTSMAETSTTISGVPTMFVTADSSNVDKQWHKIRMTFVDWMAPHIKSIQSLPTEKQLQSAVCIIWCLSRLAISFDNATIKDVSPIVLKLLCAQKPTVEGVCQWMEYNLLKHFLADEKHRGEVAEAVRKLVRANSVDKRDALSMDWIYGIPLYSFLTNTFEPYEDVRTRTDNALAESWNTLKGKFKLTDVRRKCKAENSKFLEKHYSNVEALLHIDPLTLQAFLFVCPDEYLSELFTRISPNVCIAWLSFIMTNLSYTVTTNSESTQWKAWICAIEKSVSVGKFPSAHECSSALLDSTALFFKRCTMFVRTTLPRKVSVITAAASLLCTTLQYIQGEKEKMCALVFTDTLKLLRDWISKTDVIGGRMFGSEVIRHSNRFLFSLGNDEIEIWKLFLSMECADLKIHEMWKKSIHELVSERVSNVPDDAMVQLLWFVEQNGNEVLTNIVMNNAVKSAEIIMLKSSDELFREDSKAFGNLLGVILEKRYPELKKGSENGWITLDILLEWVVWPNYLTIVQQGHECLLTEGLSQECQIACVCAVSKFRDICEHIQSGNVTVYDLHKISTHRELVERLCEAVEDKGRDSKVVSALLDQRVQEFLFVERRQRAYQAICNWIPDPSKVEGLDILKEELVLDINDTDISELCQLEDGSPQLLCYTAAKPLDPFVEHFDIMMKQSSILFLHPLSDRLRKTLATRSGLTIAHIYPEVWQPVFEHCQNLLESLVDQSMTLSFVDQHLQNLNNLDNAVFDLAVGVTKCMGTQPTHGPLRSALCRIKQYWKLCQYQAGAHVFLRLRDVLNLKGDFNIVEGLSQQLMESMKDQTLATIDSNLVETGQFLEEIVSDPQKDKCLQTFVNSQEIIGWLKGFTTSVNDIQGFVTVALATAAGGEGDLASDKLSHLRTVGSGFASLIYEVKESDDYQKLKDRCKSLWEALVKNRNLPELLKSCNNDIEWYKSIKETQGSVETTSYGQMTSILRYGTYRVGFKKNPQALHDVISVTLSRRYQNLVKWKYTLDELRDLESKLVLICGNKAENRAEVDHYLNLLHCATSIAELYQELQRAGDVTYSNTSLEFKCVRECQFNEMDAKLRVAALRKYISNTLEWDLIAWKRSVESAREKYYELNYFTTLQLLQLRKELGILSLPGATHKVNPIMLMLLKSISPQVTSRVVIDSLHGTELPEPMNGKGGEEAIFAANISANTDSEAMELDYTLHTAILPCSGELPFVNPLTPTLTFEDLNELQKKTYTMLVNGLNYSKDHVLRAFQECGQDAGYFLIEAWCDDNEDLSSEIDVATLDEELSAGTGIYNPVQSDEEESAPGLCKTSQTTNVVPEGPTPDVNLQVQTVVKQSVDESHLGVKELVGVGYDLHECMEAIDQCSGDVEKAMKLLDAMVMKDGAQPGVFVRSISREEQTLNPSEAVGDGIAEARDPDACKSHLELDQLGRVLEAISKHSPGAVTVQRPFTNFLKTGFPNLLVTAHDNVLSSVLALYTEDNNHSLPTQEEVLLCTASTTTEEVSLLWRRSIDDPYFMRVFCLAHAEKLSHQVCDTALRSLQELSQGRTDYRLVVICSEKDEDKSHIITRLHNCRRPVVPSLIVDNCREYLKAHFVQQLGTEVHSQVVPTSGLQASMVDPDNSCVRVVSSTRSGMGKSLYIKRMAASLRQVISSDDIHVTIPIHGPVVTADTLMDCFKEHTGRDNCTIYHLDIAPTVLAEVDCILFSLLILSGLSDSRGLVWRSHTSHLYVVEVTLPEKLSDQEGLQTIHLLNLLPIVKCASPGDVIAGRQQQPGTDVVGMDGEEFEGPTIQRVYQYLRRHTGGRNLDTFSYQGSVEGNERDCLKLILSKCGIRDPSWAEISHFSKFLDIQLNSCENSVFCDETFVGDVMSGLKGFVVKFMIRMSQDFSTPSLEGVLARENLEEDEPAAVATGDDYQLEQYQIVQRRQWEQTSHPYIFFNEDTDSITFVGFLVTPKGDLVDPINGEVLEPAIMRPQLYTGLKRNRVNFDEDYRSWGKEQMINKIATVMGLDYVHDPDSTYVLTTDNLIKMLAIQMRFRCGIPVVIMGETGCGKTRLIRYMCDLARGGLELNNMLILKIHGGISDKHVTKFVMDAERVAQINEEADPKLSTVVFFDEANTTDSIGLIKEVMCDRRINGRPVSRNLKFIAACNPYRKHSEEMIEKLDKAGLGFYVRVSETQQKLGKIPLRQLVYRVLDLPHSMRPLVYDFGQLNTGTEQDYTSQIVKDHVLRHPQLSKESPAIIPAISVVLAASQKFMRIKKDECSFVSLRDVERAMIVFEYFFEKMESVFAPLTDQKALEDYNERYAVGQVKDDEVAALPPRPIPLNNITRALILSLSVCYHARLQNRACYEKEISRCFNHPLLLAGGDQQFRDEIKWCEEGLLDEMKLGPNIAKNAALRENVFMMAVCIELRIPLFLVGKPGSSKSLAKSIIQDSMHGQGSQSSVLREFKQVHIFSFQCTQLCTPESVIEVFKQAERFQANQDINQYVSVVVLDEVGLAEDSPSLPLKALHPLLEDGTAGSDKNHQQQTVNREKRVAFIGISNWALDPAKMNRGVMVTRGDPGKDDLVLSAESICSNKKRDPVKDKLKHFFDPLSRAYLKICRICEKEGRQFFGLRDFYSLIKMLYWMCEKSGECSLSSAQLQHAVSRNFGGLELENLKPLEIFRRTVHIKDQDFTGMDQKMLSILNPDCSRLGLIKTSLNTKDTTWHGENRYLLFLTENYAALDILKHYLHVGGEGVDDQALTSQPYILFGSSFPKDKEYTQVCRNINQIKICMETGRTVILLNLDNYESLYDVLNQYYMYYSGVRYVDLGLQTHRVKCRVHKDFKLILIAEKDTVYDKFPTPLINRLEKHFVLTSSILEDWQSKVLSVFEIWIQNFSRTSDYRGNHFSEAHAFIGYQKDTPAAVVFQATNLLRRLRQNQALESKTEILLRAGIIKQDFANLLEDSPQWSDAVLKLSQFLLLQTAADYAIIRLKESTFSPEEVDCLMNWYFEHQQHSSIGEFLQYECSHHREVFMQVTTHCPLMTQEELFIVTEAMGMGFALFDLHEFDSELDFSNKIGPKFLRDKDNAKPFVVIIQCDSGHLNSDLIACTRYRVCDEAIRAKNKNRIHRRGDVTHILLVIRLPQQEVNSQFVGFQGDPWISVHIDDLRPTSEVTVIPEQALNAFISELFIGRLNERHVSSAWDEIGDETVHQHPQKELDGQDNYMEADNYESEEMSDIVGENMSDDSSSSSDEEAGVWESLQLPSLEVANKMDTEPLFKVPEVASKDNSLHVDTASIMMNVEDVEDEQLYDQTLKNLALPQIEQMQTDELDLLSEEAEISQPSGGLVQDSLTARENVPSETAMDENSIEEDAHISDVSPAVVTSIPTYPGPPEQEADTSLEQSLLEKARESRPFHPQHRRLQGRVQAAVSMLKDSQRDRAVLRIQRLMALIPKTPPEKLDETVFYGLLVKLIHSALKQREELKIGERDWVLTEAMSGRKLQNGGTFRNVLARRIDEVVTPFFAEIIAHADQNCNLDLLDPKNLDSPIARFWLKMFNLTGGRIDFSSLAKGKTTIKTEFHCRLPFSWFVWEVVNAQGANVRDISNLRFALRTMCEALSLSEVGVILDSVQQDHVYQFYELYLHDFVRFVHKSTYKNDLNRIEYQLIMDSLNALTLCDVLCSTDGHESFTRKIVALHLIYSQYSSEVLQFGQLVLHRPGILSSLFEMYPLARAGKEEFTLHLCAVQRVLESDQEDDDPTSQYLAGLNPPLHEPQQDKVTQNLQRWLNHVRLSRNVIDTILRSSIVSDAAIKSRLTWQRIRALQIFAENVYMPHSRVKGVHFITKKLEITLKRHSDFLKKDTLHAIKQYLNVLFNLKQLDADKRTKDEMKKNCDRFFIEIVSSLCFGGREAPEPELVEMLLDKVLQVQDQKTSKLSAYKDQDKIPTIRSFLLQLLLEHKPEQVRQYLDNYFQRSRVVISGHDMDQGLCLLCIQCLEDALCKRVGVLPPTGQANKVGQVLEDSYLALLEHLHSVSLQYLEAVASVRFALSVLAQELKSDRVNNTLLRVARDLCMDTRLNVIDPTGRVDTTGPVLYLMKLLVRQFGFPFLHSVSQTHPWVIPEGLRRVHTEEKSIDSFVLYEHGYKDVRNAVNTALFTSKTTELTACMQSGAEVYLLAFAFYQKATLSRASTAPAEHLPEEALQTLNTFVQDYPNLSPEMLQVLRLLLANQQGGTLAQMVASPYQAGLHRSLTGLVVHTVTVLLSMANTELLLPFFNMLTNPISLQNAYLPTMQEDLLHEVRKAGGKGQFYQCQQGHPYFVGECGQPMEQKTCCECGSPIGGNNHELLTSNTSARGNDTTKTGHDLGSPQQRLVNTQRERDLSATAVSIVRVLMHASFLWAACHNEHQLMDIARVTKGVVPLQDLAEFFWLHLEKDIECMQHSTGKGADECVMIMHLMLKQILTTNHPVSPVTANVNHLHSKDARKEWEKLFNASYIEPVLSELEAFIAGALDLVIDDDQQEQGRLFYLAYELVKVDEGKLEAHLWSYRPQINLEHLKSTVQAGSDYKILDTFLQAEPSLRATQYLPDIIKLQQFMFDAFNRRLDKNRAETMNIREFLRKVKYTRNENTKNECQEMIESVKKAWALVGQKLKNHNPLPVEEDFLLPEITGDTKLVYLIPTTMREGRCTTSLVHYLVLTHNDFIERCRGIISQGSESASAVWREHKVPITHIRPCHLLEYEHHLQSIILSHCHYSLTVGRGRNIKYNLPALEKHVLDKFIYGKPVILQDIPNVAYLKDIYTVETFLEIRRKVKPQEPLPQRIQQDIVTELRTPDKLRESLDVVDIILGLLSSGGGSHTVMLEKYISTRRMGGSFSAKAKEHCTLGHIISLWETISVELSRQLWHTGQEPFEGIPPKYSRCLFDDQTAELDKCLRTYDLGLLLGSLFEFIEVHVKHITVTANEEDFPLVEAIQAYWDMTKQSPIPLERLRRDFPVSITVPQAMATWKHIAEYKEKEH